MQNAWINGLSLVLLFVSACGDDSRHGAAGDGGLSADGPPASWSNADGGAQCALRCASDLHAIVDCNGVEVTACPADQGCDPTGVCVPACASAAANRSSVGCDYHSFAPPFSLAGSSCYAVFVANTWGSDVTLSVDRGGASLDVSKFGYIPQGGGKGISYTPLAGGVLPKDGVAVLFLNEQSGGFLSDPAKCVGGTPAVQNAAIPGTGRSPSFHIAATAPVVAYDMFPYGGGAGATASATLLLPTSVWEKNYVAVSDLEAFAANASWIALVAAEDGTEITVNPKHDIVGAAGVPATTAGAAGVYSLDKGQVLTFQQAGDLSGSIVLSTKPIALFGGSPLTLFPLGVTAADGTHQQIPPISALSNRYVAVRYRNRLASLDEAPPWRLVGTVDGTQLSYDPPVAGAPTVIGRGEVVEFLASGPFVVTSQAVDHPFYFGAHMTGCAVLGNQSEVGCAGDPESVNVVPPEQFLRRYAFFTDPTYPETNLVFVRQRAADGLFKDVTLDCVGVISAWKPIGGTNEFEYARADLVRGNFEKQGQCDNGRHLASSDAPFGLTVWGWGTNQSLGFMSEAVSYAYPAGAGVQHINAVVVPPIL